jgi:hypothetical protein
METTFQRRVITTHNKALSTILVDDSLEPVPGFAANAVTIWKTDHHPAELTDVDPTSDAAGVQIYTRGSLIRVVDFPPNSTGHRHRTKSLDYAIIMSGEIQLALDDSSTTILCQGDVVVQQSVR